MPDNLDVPAHQLMREIAADGPWADDVGSGVGGAHAHRSGELVLRAAAPGLQQGRCMAHHLLSRAAGGAAAIVEWFKGSGLRPFLEPLDAPSRAAYLERYTAAVARAYPPLADGSVLLPFPRLSWWRFARSLGGL